MDETIIEALILQLTTVNEGIKGLNNRLEKFYEDFREFEQRFEDLIERVEHERRVDYFSVLDES